MEGCSTVVEEVPGFDPQLPRKEKKEGKEEGRKKKRTNGRKEKRRERKKRKVWQHSPGIPALGRLKQG